MSILSQQDIDVRLQLINCCLAEKTNLLIDKISIGSNDVDCRLEELQVLQKLLKFASCYKLIENIDAQLIVNLNKTFGVGWTIIVYANGEQISDPVITTNNDATDGQAIADAINNYGVSGFSCTYEFIAPSTNRVILNGPCTNPDITIDVNSGASIISLAWDTLGTCITDNNCITEEELIKIFDYISTKCKLCFQPQEFKYT